MLPYLNSILQNRNRELIGRITREPQSEISGRVGRIQALAYLLQLRHPRDREVTVLQANPASLVLGTLNQSLGYGTLTLTQRYREKSIREVRNLGELGERPHGVRARGQDEDQGNQAVSVGEGAGDVERRGRYVSHVHGFSDVYNDLKIFVFRNRIH